jgi:carbon storage regulator CsrA
MLVITLRPGAELRIGGDIRLVVVAVKGRRVRIGCTAPPAVRVDRHEIREQFSGSTSSLARKKAGSSPPRNGHTQGKDSEIPRRQPPAATSTNHKKVKDSRRK